MRYEIAAYRKTPVGGYLLYFISIPPGYADNRFPLAFGAEQ